MSYFSDHYRDFSYPIRQGDDSPGFREAQLGAIHAAAAHFIARTDPGIVTMPTGSGKTAVLIAAAFVLRAQRILIIAPSRLVREQIAEEVSSLSTLKRALALPENLEGPTVFSTKKRVGSADDWEAMRQFDVVVGTVQSISPEFESIPEPPPDLFDLILVDEAHHSPARTWRSLLDHFPDAKRLLFTATPFRQDQKEIRGRFIYTYDLKDAYQDRVFGQISYAPVIPAQGQSHDVAVALAAEQQYQTDRAAGFDHRIMVRTDSRKRADELATIYGTSTKLRLSIITGDKSLRYAKKVIKQLEDGELDGIICVNMLGEGFNFPQLKIAAIHSPHRSLSVTLQFVGRFARTAGENLGPATFLAVPSDIEIEAERLYDTGAVWQEVVQNLSAARVNQEAQIREVLESFSPPRIVAEDLEDLSLYSLEPYYHVKVYQLDAEVDLSQQVAFPDALQIVYQSMSVAHNAAVYITREISLPRWTDDDRLAIIQPDLFIFFQDRASKLLFICASRRSDGLYEQLAGSFATANPRPLPLYRLNRALNDLVAPEFFNVGMRNRVATNTTESYRIITGSNADKAILKSDGRLYHRGHVFGRASDDGELVTIGLSSASKVWSNRSSQLPDLIEWCETLASRINSGRMPASGSGLDHLAVGEEIDTLPQGIVGVAWPVSIFRSPPTALFEDAQGQIHRAQLLDFDIEVDGEHSTASHCHIILRHSLGVEYRATFSFETERFFEPASQQEPEIVIERERESISIIHFLNAEMPQFYTADLALVDGYTILRQPAEDQPVFDASTFEVVDWDAAGVDIRREFGEGRDGLISVHSHLQLTLESSTAAVVYYDHGTGEIADFVAFDQVGERLLIRFYHCKGAGGDQPGHRLGDVYEITGQVVKSTTWALKQRILSHIRRRFNQNLGSHTFVRGTLAELSDLIEQVTPAQIDFEFVAVQPGLARGNLPPEFCNLLAGASDHLVRGGFLPLRILGSE